jgi:hypothetical protein
MAVLIKSVINFQRAAFHQIWQGASIQLESARYAETLIKLISFINLTPD